MKRLEEKEQAAVIEWASFARIPGTNEKVIDYLIAIPNEGQRHPRTGARFKQLGLKPGVSDLFLAFPCGAMHGCWIEMKKKRKDFRSAGEANSAVAENQKDWLIRMQQANYFARVAYGADEAIQIIKTYAGVK